ncbi:hypothetical protein [Porticoccus sp.]
MGTVQPTVDTTQYVQVNTGNGTILLHARHDAVRVVFSDAKPAADNPVYHLLDPRHPPLQIPYFTTNVWVKATSEKAVVTVTENEVITGLPPGSFPSEYPLPAAQYDGLAKEAKQLPDNHNVTVSNQITQPTTPSDTQPVSADSLPLPSGAATAAKQLPDNHNVTVSNQITGFATEAKQLPNGHDVHVSNSQLEVDLGNIPGIQNLSITGVVVTGVDSGSETDVWSGADSTLLGGGQKEWIKPTAAQIHSVVSDSISDTAAGTGMRTALVRGLVDWNTNEVSETVTLNGLTPVNTVNSYVCLNDITVLTCGTDGPNVGTIEVKAVTDNTLQLVMRAEAGRSTRAIYAVPSTQRVVFKRWNGLMTRTTGSGDFMVFRAKVDLTPQVATTCWILADERTTVSNGTSSGNWVIDPPPTVMGPTIIKISAEGSRNNLSAVASMGFHLVDN